MGQGKNPSTPPPILHAGEMLVNHSLGAGGQCASLSREPIPQPLPSPPVTASQCSEPVPPTCPHIRIHVPAGSTVCSHTLFSLLTFLARSLPTHCFQAAPIHTHTPPAPQVPLDRTGPEPRLDAMRFLPSQLPKGAGCCEPAERRGLDQGARAAGRLSVLVLAGPAASGCP